MQNLTDIKNHLFEFPKAKCDSFLPPANVVCEGYVLQVSVCPQGGGGIPACLAGHMTRPPSLPRRPPAKETPPKMFVFFCIFFLFLCFSLLFSTFLINYSIISSPPLSMCGRYASHWNAFL